MLRRLFVAATFAALGAFLGGPLFTPDATVAHASSGYCEYADSATAYRYDDGSPVGSSGGSGVYLDGETVDQCVAVAQNYAIADSGSACGGYESGVAYAVVEWHVWWNGEDAGAVVQQYDCGDV